MAAVPYAAPDPDRTRNPAPSGTPALRVLLDHLAEELVRDYIRLMEHAARDDAAVPIPPPEES